MKLPVTLKPLLIAAALLSAGSVGAVTSSPSLPMGAADTIIVQGESFSDTFSFYVPTLSKFSAYLGSSNLSFGPYLISALDFGSISLSSGAVGNISNTGSKHSGDISAVLGQGNYTLTVSGTAFPIASAPGFPPLGTGGSYTIYGNLAPVPEPETYAMFLAGLGIIGAVAGRRRKNI